MTMQVFVNYNKKCGSRSIKNMGLFSHIFEIEIIHLNIELKLNNSCKHSSLKISMLQNLKHELRIVKRIVIY